eukprot:364196-Lingulodinium_polyedra.AAC.1
MRGPPPAATLGASAGGALPEREARELWPAASNQHLTHYSTKPAGYSAASAVYHVSASSA